MRYTATFLAVTIAALALGIVLWNSEAGPITVGDSSSDWAQGAEGAQVVIESFVDFT